MLLKLFVSVTVSIISWYSISCQFHQKLFLLIDSKCFETDTSHKIYIFAYIFVHQYFVFIKRIFLQIKMNLICLEKKIWYYRLDLFDIKNVQFFDFLNKYCTLLINIFVSFKLLLIPRFQMLEVIIFIKLVFFLMICLAWSTSPKKINQRKEKKDLKGITNISLLFLLYPSSMNLEV